MGDNDFVLPDLKPLNVWTLIETYFRDNPDYKSQHQVDSYNEFLFSKTNGIDHIIRRENPHIIHKDLIDKTNYRYQINIYYGEKLNETTGEVNTKIIDNLYFSAPIQYDNKDSTYMFPNIARIKGYTYASNIYCNIGVIFRDNLKDTTVIKNFTKVNIGSMPIMVKSKLCILSDLDDIRLSELGECPYDTGGYFIIKGKEKVFLSQEKKINNILYINSQNDEINPLQVSLRSSSNEGFQSTRNNTIVLSRIRKEYNPINSEKAISKKYDRYHIKVRILGVGTLIPLFILFWALCFETDKKIIQTIIYDSDDKLLRDKLIDELMESIGDSKPIYTQETAMKFIAIHTKGKEIINVIDLLSNNLFPNYSTNVEKGYFLGLSVRKLLLTKIGNMKETDRDSYANKRIDLAGSLLLELYRELWAIFKRNISLKIDNDFKFHFKEYGNKIENLINDDNYGKVFNPKSMDMIVKSFGSVFGTGLSGRQGIIQDLNRNSMLGTLSHVRRLSYPLPPGSKSFGPRKLHNSQWGFVCPTESPDGGNVGIINHLSISARVSFTVSENEIIRALKDHGMIELKSSISEDFNELSKIFINGRWIGLHKDPIFLYKLLRLLKLNSIIHLYTSIYWDILSNEIYVFCDSGRLLRPLLVLKQMGDTYSNELIEGNLEYCESWSRLIRGNHMFKKYSNLSVYDERYHDDELKLIKEKYPDYISYLEDNCSQIEYVDPLETEGFFIGKDINSLDKKYSHCEIHSSLILSAVALNIPFPEHSQYPRNVFSCQQTKQAVGLYSSSYNTRFDTFSHVLNYPQKPIVTTRYKKYTDVDKLPYGINAIVAVASYTGYNQEDSVMLNKTSIERGMFQSLYTRSYEDSEESDGKRRIYFGLPKKDSKLKSTINFDKLDINGIVKEGYYVDSNDAIISKCGTDTNLDGTKVETVEGKTVKFSTSGIVDRVVVSENQDNLRTCKVRIRKNKIPTVGDKYASRAGQKGMCGLVLEQSEMPFTKDGIVPDLIINPHAIPSRMTINQLLECILGKSSVMGGYLGDATPFQNTNLENYTKLLESYGFEGEGNEILYSGITGEQIKSSIFIGPTYYQRLKIMVADKMHSRGKGPLQSLIRQPAAGRSNNGGLRIGEMEEWAIWSHGMSSFMRESMMDRSDKYSMMIDKTSGLISNDLSSDKNVSVDLPYAMKMMLQELQSMSIGPRLITDDSIVNHDVHNFISESFHAKI